MCLFKCIKRLVSEHPLAVNVLTSPKNSWNLPNVLLSYILIILSRSEVDKVLFNQIWDLGLVDSTFPANCENFRIDRENLPLPIQIKLSKKPDIFCSIFFAFFESTINFQCSEKKPSLIGQVLLKLLIPGDVFI